MSMALRAGVVCGRRAGRSTELTVDLDSTVCEVCGRAKHGAAYGHTKVSGLSPAGGGARQTPARCCTARMRSGSSQRGHEPLRCARPWRGCGAWRRTRALTVRADSGFFSYDMIDGHRATTQARPTRSPIPHRRQGQSSQRGHRRRRLEGDRVHPRRARPKWLRPPSSPASRGDKLRGDDAKPAQAAPHHAAQPPRSAPRASCGPTGATTAFVTDRDDLDTKAADAYHRGHATSRARHQRPQRRLRAAAAAPRDSSPPTAPGSPAAVLAHNLAALGGPPRAHSTPRAQLTVAATIRNRLLTVPGTPRQPQRPTQTAPAAQLAMGTTPSPPPCNDIRNLPLLI